MDIMKKQRTVQRTLFTKSLNSFTAKCNDATSKIEKLRYRYLRSRMKELEFTNSRYNDLLSETGAVKRVIETEMEANDAYKQKFLESRLSYLGQLNATIQQNAHHNRTMTQSEKPFKRPILKVMKYNGGESTWLRFWSHFRKIHEDKTVPRKTN